jgi:hypothetical protein
MHPRSLAISRMICRSGAGFSHSQHGYGRVGGVQGRAGQPRRCGRFAGDDDTGALLQQIRGSEGIPVNCSCCRPNAFSTAVARVCHSDWPVRWSRRAKTSAIMPLPDGVTLSAAERGRVSGTSVAPAAVE